MITSIPVGACSSNSLILRENEKNKFFPKKNLFRSFYMYTSRGGCLNKDRWFAEILSFYEKPLLRFAVSKVPTSVAQELTQESFLRLWKEDPIRLKENVGPWLFHVCRNLCLDWLKSEGKRKSQQVEHLHLADPAELALQQMIERQQENQLSKKIESLSANHREVLKLKFQDGFSYQEIAEITGHSESYVGVLIHEAVKDLRQNLFPGKGKQGENK